MNPVDAIVMALTPGSPFNQNGKVFRSAKALAQFASVPQDEVLGLVAENLADRTTIRPSAKRPENGPLIALTEFVPEQAEVPEAPQVEIVAGNAVNPAAEEAEMDAPEPAPLDGPLEVEIPKIQIQVAEEEMVEDDEADEED